MPQFLRLFRQAPVHENLGGLGFRPAFDDSHSSHFIACAVFRHREFQVGVAFLDQAYAVVDEGDSDGGFAQGGGTGGSFAGLGVLFDLLVQLAHVFQGFLLAFQLDERG